MIKAKLVLDCLHNLDAQNSNQILSELKRHGGDVAIPLLVHLAVRHNALYAIQPSLHKSLVEKSAQSPDIILDRIEEAGEEQYCYIRIAGETRLEAAAERLHKLLKNTSDPKVIQAVVYALGNLACAPAVDDIGEFLLSDAQELIHAAIEALQKIGSDRAVQFLCNCLGMDQRVDLPILDALGEIQSERCIQTLIQTLASHTAYIRNHGKSILVKLGTKSIPLLIGSIASDNIDMQIHALNVLQEIGDEKAVDPIRQLLNGQPTDANVRFAGYEALAGLPAREGDYVLATGLADVDESIRLATARLIDKRMDDTVHAGVKNMINQKDAEAVRIIKAVVDAETKMLFLNLLDSVFFES